MYVSTTVLLLKQLNGSPSLAVGLASTPREAACGAQFVFACVGNDDDLRSVVLGENGALAGMDPGSVFGRPYYGRARVERELSQEAAERQIGWVDAPVSGGQSGAENGCLTVLAAVRIRMSRQQNR